MEFIEDTFRPVALRMSIPRWVCIQMRDLLWMLDDLRVPPAPKQAQRLMRRQTFPLGLAFYQLDLMARDGDEETLEDWRSKAEDEGISLAIERPPPGARRRNEGGGPKRGARKRRPTRGGRGRSRGGRGRSSGGSARVDPHAPEAGAWSPPPPPT
jgi:hypothetical protein